MSEPNKINYWKLFSFFSLFLGFAFGFFVANKLGSQNPIEDLDNESQVRLGGYKYINPLLECELSDDRINKEVAYFKDELVNLIQKEIKSGSVTEASVYFRDLNNGPWIGINEKEDFTPASLLKVPIMIAYLKKAENDSGYLAKEIVYNGENIEDYQQNVTPEVSLERGKSYSIEDLINRMIVYSDNAALMILSKNLDENYYVKTYRDLGVDLPIASKTENFMSIKQYAAFFRILYNASYLNKEMSEKALEILSKTRFNQGIIAGLPTNLVVAHKFGERGLSNSDVRQLHDCGIVYYPDHPYLLCVMTRGNSIPRQSSVIKDISQLVYSQFEEKFKE